MPSSQLYAMLAQAEREANERPNLLDTFTNSFAKIGAIGKELQDAKRRNTRASAVLGADNPIVKRLNDPRMGDLDETTLALMKLEADAAPIADYVRVKNPLDGTIELKKTGVREKNSSVSDLNLKENEPTTVPLVDEKGRVIANIPANAKTVKTESGSPKEPKAPTGYRYTADGTLEAIPGGPADLKNKAEQAKAQGLADSMITKADTVIDRVDRAVKKVSGWTAGPGSKLAVIPGTPAKDLASEVLTIKANLGFNELQEMRRNSPTGGALGQVAVQELEALQSTIGNLDPAQSPEQLTRNLNDVKRHYFKWKAAVQAANAASAPAQSGSPRNEPYPATGANLNSNSASVNTGTTGNGGVSGSAVHEIALQEAERRLMANPNDEKAKAARAKALHFLGRNR